MRQMLDHSVAIRSCPRQRSSFAAILLAAGAVVLLGAPGSARADGDGDDQSTHVVKVPATAQPWDTRINPNFNFGLHNGRGPVTIFDPALHGGAKVHFTVTGSTITVSNGSPIDGDGELDFPTVSQPEFGWPRFPSRYFAKGGRTAYLNGLSGAFVDADGRIIGKPFFIGKDAVIGAPDDTAAVVLGINDDNFSDNSGALTVTVKVPKPRVIVG